MSRYRWIVFDADGTLFDYERAELSALTRTFEHHGLHFDSTIHQVFAEINGRQWLAFEMGNVSSRQLRVRRFEELASTLEIELCAGDFSVDYLRNLGSERTLLPGAEEVVEALSQKFSLLLATNGFAEVQHNRFSSSSIRPFFKGIVISDEIGVAKPDPEFFSEVLSQMGNPNRAEVLMVGDSLSSDIAGGVGFGIDTCWFNPYDRANDSSIEPTYEISDLQEIVTIAETG